MRRLIVFMLLFLFYSSASLSQTVIISNLKSEMGASTSLQQKLDKVFAICEQRMSLPTDTLVAYAKLARELANKTGNEKKILLADYYRGQGLVKLGLLDSGLQLVNSSLPQLNQWMDEMDLQQKYAVLKAQIFIKTNRHKEAIQECFKVLATAEKRHDTLTQIIARNNIGWAYMEMEQNREAINWFYRAINTTTNSSYLEQYNYMLANMAATYNSLGVHDSAEYFVNKALYYAKKQQNLQGLANALNIQADIFIDTKRPQLAEASLTEALVIRKQIGDPFYVVSDVSQLALFYANNGSSDEGIAISLEGIAMAEQYKLTSKLPILYNALAENYKAAGNYKAYAQTLQKLLAVKDTVYKMASAEALASLEAQYNLQKKENIIIQQQLALVRKNYWIYGSLIFSIFIFCIGYLLFTNYRRRQQSRLLVLQQEEKLNTAKAILHAEEAERKRIAADLHDSLGAYAASIASNIDHLDGKLVHDKQLLHDLRTNSQSIVSQLNDTIWVLKKDALSLTALSDRLKIFLQRLQSSYPRVVMDVQEDVVTDHLLAPWQAFHLFQMIKEAIINALKHSHGHHLQINIAGNEGWCVSIEDDGQGFVSQTRLAEGGNGLVNMKERAGEAGCTIIWKANKPSGTKVIIRPTTN